MKKWKVIFGEASTNILDTFEVNFFDVSEYTDQDYVISDDILEEIIILTQNKNNYHLMHNIKQIKNSDGEDYSKKNSVVILGTNILEQKFGMLFIKRLEKSFNLIALWPEEFLFQFSENTHLLIDYLSDIVNSPNSFYDISIIVP
ncbi:MAG: hypothetical protein ACTSPY_00310 [Candidatus Helarchaeota archaeon]